MTVTLDVEYEQDPVRVLPVPVTTVDVVLLSGQARLNGWSLRDGTTSIPLENEGNVTSPGASTAISTLSGLAAGTYQVGWTVGLAATLAAADANNFVLTHNGVFVVQSINGFAAGEYPQQPFEFTVAANDNMIIKNIAAGTVGAVYSGQLTLTPVTIAESIAELQDGNNILGEISFGGGAVDTHHFAHTGLRVRNQIKLHVVSGAVVGAVYARFQKNTG
jgi:hypothetical protein